MTKPEIRINEKGGGETDTKLGVSDGAGKAIQIEVNIPVNAFPSTSFFDEKAGKSSALYVGGIVASIFCCLPCVLIGVGNVLMKRLLAMNKAKDGVDNQNTCENPGSLGVLTANKVSKRQQACWYVWSILASVFCCLPCGLIGLVHAMIAKHEGEKGNFSGQKRRLFQAKCWTSWSIALGLLFLGLTVLTVCMILLCPMNICYYQENGNNYNMGTQNVVPPTTSQSFLMGGENLMYNGRSDTGDNEKYDGEMPVFNYTRSDVTDYEVTLRG